MTAGEAARAVLSANERGVEVVSVLFVSGPRSGERLVLERNELITTSSQEILAIAKRAFDERAAVLQNEMFAEFHAPQERLIIFGAGHIAVPLANIGALLGFHVLVLDDREDFARPARFPDSADVRVLDLADPLQGLTINENCYVVLVTRAHKYDFDCLQALLQREARPRYIGMIGSRRRVRAAFSALMESGITADALTEVHAPIGIDIGAETPVEIAVSIAAEIVRMRRGGSAETLRSTERVVDRFFPEPSL